MRMEPPSTLMPSPLQPPTSSSSTGALAERRANQRFNASVLHHTMSGWTEDTQAACSSNAMEMESTQPPEKKHKHESSAGWCADCWAEVKDACREGHQLLDDDEAVTEWKGRLDALVKEAADARQDAAVNALVAQGPALLLEVEGCNGEGCGVQGGIIRIALAASMMERATVNLVTVLWEALDGATLEFDEAFKMAHVDLDPSAHLAAAMDKLPSCRAGQLFEPGAVFLDSNGTLDICLVRVASEGLHGARVLGFLRGSVDALRVTRCGGHSGDCFCRKKTPARATLRGVRRVAGVKQPGGDGSAS
ncbi:uncharacterized protein LOC117642720 isoform X3 [Thrips palmi]|uniref:Uncharacterized protein LOC117642720 isoform X3 n=1 Tax=Thrips palmi TaxID=161013 RepID=A0A6P8YK37_THRPL|nr:uncharacterized protein LOC117642720 isoform X3 [Thrips palmi]